VQSAKAWYQKLRHDLEGIGYSVIKSDECVFIRKEKDGTTTRLVVHVDDIFASAKDETVMDLVMGELEQLYGGF
jgi:prophage tail gpP-like protein